MLLRAAMINQLVDCRNVIGNCFDYLLTISKQKHDIFTSYKDLMLLFVMYDGKLDVFDCWLNKTSNFIELLEFVTLFTDISYIKLSLEEMIGR